MGETKDKTGGTGIRTIRINRGLLIAVAVLLVALLALTAMIAPRYGRIFSAYKAQKKIYDAASIELKDTEDENAHLEMRWGELKDLTAEANEVRDQVFRLASKLESDIRDGKSDRKICYITIDDGPYNRGKKYLELFNKYDIKATFFLTTANGDKLPDKGELTATSMYPEYIRYGHTIGNHTYSHNYSENGIYKNSEAFMKAVEKQQKFTSDATGGYTPKIIRFPGGSGMAGSKLEDIEAALKKAGYGWIDWTIDSGDSWGAEKATVKRIRNNVLKAAKDPNQKIMVALFHEWSNNTLEAMPDIIEGLQKQGYIFLPLFYDSVMVHK